jgi:serine protease
VLAELGVLIVAAAGNDATDRRMFPAAFAQQIPLLSVGAKNPSGSVALFSNSGDWVSIYETGAAVVSTLPVTFDASLQPAARMRTADGTVRETIDPDDFAVWSGTSFAAPIVAGKLARWLLAHREDAADPDVLGDPQKAVADIMEAAHT